MNSPVTGEFPSQRAGYAEMFPFDDVIMNRDWHQSLSDIVMEFFLNPLLNNVENVNWDDDTDVSRDPKLCNLLYVTIVANNHTCTKTMESVIKKLCYLN